MAGPIAHVVARVRHVVHLAQSKARERYKKKTRSPKWEKIEKAFKAKYPTCAACGGVKQLQVHHIKPYALYPALELEFTNLIAMCMAFDRECHLRLAHGGSFRCYNENVVADAGVVLANPQLRAEYEVRAKNNRKPL